MRRVKNGDGRFALVFKALAIFEANISPVSTLNISLINDAMVRLDALFN